MLVPRNHPSTNARRSNLTYNRGNAKLHANVAKIEHLAAIHLVQHLFQWVVDSAIDFDPHTLDDVILLGARQQYLKKE